MTIAIPNLWPDEVKVDILTPLAILRAQIPNLVKMTGGLLDAEVTSIEVTRYDGRVLQHQLDIIAHALNGYRHRILTATHDPLLVYPVRVRPETGDLSDLAYNQQDFMQEVSSVLQSNETMAVIHSLIARSNEATITSEEDTTDNEDLFDEE